MQTLISNERMILRQLEKIDAERLYIYRNQPEVMLFQGWTPESVEEVEKVAHEMSQRRLGLPGEWNQIVIQLTETECAEQSVIGDVAFCIDTETNQQAELGIALDTSFQGKGYAQDAVRLLVKYLFTEFKLHRIHVSIDPDNMPSRKLCERIGFRQEGHLKQACYFKGQWTDDVIMAILNSEWRRDN